MAQCGTAQAKSRVKHVLSREIGDRRLSFAALLGTSRDLRGRKKVPVTVPVTDFSVRAAA